MRDSGALHGNLNEVLLGVLDALADCVRNLGSLAGAEANGTLAVAYNDQRRKLHYAAALNGLGYTVERYDGLRVLVLTLIVSVKLSHVLPPPRLKTAGRPRGRHLRAPSRGRGTHSRRDRIRRSQCP